MTPEFPGGTYAYFTTINADGTPAYPYTTGRQYFGMPIGGTPSLRNIALTAPYMHDGRFATLEEVVEHYSTGIHRSPTLDPNLAKHPETGLHLEIADKAALVAFLKTLTDVNPVAP